MPSERSRPSAITGLNAARTKVVSISLQTCCKPFWMTASVTGSIVVTLLSLRNMDDHITQYVDLRPIAGMNHGRRIQLLQNRGAQEFAIQWQAISIEDRCRQPSVFEPDASHIYLCVVEILGGGAGGQCVDGERLSLSDHSGMQIGEHGFDFGKRNPEAVPVGFGKRLVEIGNLYSTSRQRDVQDMRLTLELHVSCVEDLHVFNFDIFVLKNVVSLFDMRVEHGDDVHLVDHGKRLVDCPHKVMPQVRNETTQSVRQT